MTSTDPDHHTPLPHRADDAVGDVIGRSVADAVLGPGDPAADAADEAAVAGDRICDEDLVLVLDRADGVGWMGRGCARAHGYELVPACTGAPDLSGAPAGRPCEPGCPSRAAE